MNEINVLNHSLQTEIQLLKAETRALRVNISVLYVESEQYLENLEQEVRFISTGKF